MSLLLILLGLGLRAVAGAPSAKPLNPFQIVGGNETTIERYPFHATILTTDDFDEYYVCCSAIIINNVSILTKANCVRGAAYVQLRVRVGSNFEHSGGFVHKVTKYVTLKPFLPGPFVFSTITNLAIVRLASPIVFNEQAQPASFADPDYQLGDNEMVWASGWGPVRSDGWPVKQLRHVQTWTVNQAECAHRYAYYDVNITEDMLCASWLDVGHHGICWDNGGPLVHNGVVVGMSVKNWGCGTKYFPDLFARISIASKWIEENAYERQ